MMALLNGVSTIVVMRHGFMKISIIPTSQLSGLVCVLQLYVLLCNGRRKYGYICSRIFLRAISPVTVKTQDGTNVYTDGTITPLPYVYDDSCGRINHQ